MSGPWLTMGDFNAVLHPDDQVNGQPVHDSETRDFKDFLINTGLCELKTIGRDFTWTNGHIFSKIDKGLANSDWMSNMNQLEIEVKDPGCSDHSPLVIDFIEPLNRRSRPFKFMNHLATHQEFIPMVEKGWSKPVSGCKMKQVWVTLKHVKPEMKALHHSKFSNVEEQIKQTRQNLIDLQEHMRDLDQDSDMFEKERNLKKELEKWSMVQESIYQQKSRIKWLQLGDSNSSYFFANLKNWNAYNHIKRLRLSNDNWSDSEEEIKDEIVGFYSKLLGTTAPQLPIINPDICAIGNVLNKSQQLSLIQPVTPNKVLKALKGIEDLKAPGGDGSLYKPINCTSVTLIPKVKNPSSVIEFRPISYCSVIYKLVSKILTSRGSLLDVCLK
ncbi:hypothetical protein KY289_000655 [Solanum tuberosum]|nr:hypothetical protein KY289_000655 [Solanum tuberosum]